MQNNREKMLYRKVNTKARNVHHHTGEDFKHSRNGKKEISSKMKQGVKRGLDYTPLYKYLIKQVGKNWDDIYSKVLPRVLDEESIFHIVSKNKETAQDYCRIGESSYFSGLFINENGVLEITNKEINHSTINPFCACCTHSFNGQLFTQKFKEN